MKKDYLGMGLVAVLFLSVLGTGALCYVYLKTSRTVREAQARVGQMNVVANRNRQALQSLAMDLNEYSRRNPSILPLLDQMNLRLRASTNAPAGGRP